jgi:hypothetical protein
MPLFATYTTHQGASDDVEYEFEFELQHVFSEDV